MSNIIQSFDDIEYLGRSDAGYDWYYNHATDKAGGFRNIQGRDDIRSRLRTAKPWEDSMAKVFGIRAPLGPYKTEF